MHVVIIGFACYDIPIKRLFDYETIDGESQEVKAKNINPYLVDSEDLLIFNRSKPLCDVPPMRYGSKPTDGGYYILNEEEKDSFIKKDPNTKSVIRPFISARDFLNNSKNWCIWLVDMNPSEIRKMSLILERVEKVKKFRSESKAISTRSYSNHTLFRQVTQPNSNYILIPCHSSEKRPYIPMGFISKEVIVNNSCQAIPDAKIFHLGILTSKMHMVWVKHTCGRLESRYRYSKDIVYNNFPWPRNVNKKNQQMIEKKTQKILDVRAEFPDSSLADLYDPLTMPPKLAKAHKELDKAVDLCYRSQPFVSELNRIEFLFNLYDQYTGNLKKFL